MTEFDVAMLAALAIVFAPFIAAYGVFRSRRGAGAWKVLAFLFCVFAAGCFITLTMLPGVVLWLIAWIFAAAAVSADRRQRDSDALLAELKKQNHLLAQQVIPPPKSPSTQAVTDGAAAKAG